jgi:hypothetical protein
MNDVNRHNFYQSEFISDSKIERCQRNRYPKSKNQNEDAENEKSVEKIVDPENFEKQQKLVQRTSKSGTNVIKRLATAIY